MKKTNNTYIKTYVELFDATRSGLHALVYSFILNQAEYQKTNNPKIEQTFIQKSLNLGRKIVERILKELKEDGLIDYTKGYNYAGGKAYTTTKFTLKYEFKQESEPETAVSEPTNEEPERTNAVCSHEDEINQMGLEMLNNNDYAPQPTETETKPLKISYNRTPKAKKKKEIWQMTYDERLTSAFEEMYNWTLNGGTREKVNDKIYELFDKYDLSMCLSTFVDKYVEWKNAA